MTDNFDLIKEYIYECDPDFDKNDDKFYTIEIRQRKKDNPEDKTIKSQRTIKVYYMNKIADFDNLKNEIILMCEMFKARAYVSVNCKSYERTSKAMMVELATRIANGEYRKPQAICQSCAAKCVNSKDKRWMIDCDKEDADTLHITMDEYVNFLIKCIAPCKPNGNKIIKIIPSTSGKHIICRPFDVKQFGKELSEYYTFSGCIDMIKKNSQGTILYSQK